MKEKQQHSEFLKVSVEEQLKFQFVIDYVLL